LQRRHCRRGRSHGGLDGGAGRVRREESERLHQLVALRNGNVAVVEFLGRLAVHVEPPVALEYGLVEQRGLGTQEALLRQTVVSERAHVEHLREQTRERFVIPTVPMN